MITRKAIVSVAAAGALAIAGVAATPKPANALWWVAPAIIAGVVGGAAVGAAATNGPYYGYAPAGEVYVQPTPGCHWVRARTADGALVRERVCP